MKNTVWTLAATATVAAFAPTTQALASTSENVGIGVGGIVGAVAGGPVGFIVGSAAGAFVGDRFHKRGEKIAELDASLTTEQQRTATLTAELAAREADLATLDARIESLQLPVEQARQLLASGLAMDLLFATDTAAVDPLIAERLTALASRLAVIPDVVIELNGHADVRGTPDYNLGLSLRRAENVRSVLLDAGFPAARITVTGHGSTQLDPTDTTIDTLALQRRVEMRVGVSPTTMRGQLAGL
ncbi:MAG: OmpA family protein [Pseudomonadota bacterium]